MAIVQEFDLNMIPDSAPVIVHVNQYDEGEGRFEIHLYDGNVPYVPAAGAEAIIQGTKPDGKGFDYNATLSGSTVTADVTKQMTAVAGVVRVQVVITEGDDVTGTFVFGMDVQKSGLPADTDMSASEYQIVERMIEAAEEAEAVATQSAEDAEAWAVGQRSGSDVPPEDPTYHNNSKYWADKAHEELANKADLVDGKVPSSQLPSYVDDVVEGYYNEQDGKFYEESTFIHEITPERSKIYVDLGADITYRWSGSEYVAISNPDIAEDVVTSIVDSAAEYPVPAAGETLKVIIGKIKKYLADLKGKLDTFKSKGSATKGIYFDANGAVQEMSYTVGKSVPSNAEFTDTHVRQVRADDSSSYSYDYRVLLSNNSSDATENGYAKKSSKCTVNPYTGNLKIVKINDVDVGNSPKFTDSGHTILNGSGSAMTQRGKLQFVGADVTDDATNDKTVVNLGTTVSVTHTLSASANTNFDFTGIGANAVITEILATDGRGYASREYINSGTGIRFVFAPDSSTPSVTVQIRYR